ncbi:UNVERIFIED_CONTAM: hypothetical protein Scaly_2535600 [Sesamum calycinum]|uniref:Uncharacterized protein n=1 Tax=Sesamum calycinum TaxID=2727403 RepID=A0AAW2LVS6_9LAMI
MSSRISPNTKVQHISIDTENEAKLLQVGKNLLEEELLELSQFLENNEEAFEWGLGGVSGINADVIAHRLNVTKEAPLVKQRKRNFRQKRNKIIHEEVKRLLKVGYIREVTYPEWIANAVMALEQDGKWRLCVHRFKQRLPKGFLSFTKDKPLSGLHFWMRKTQDTRCLSEIQSNQSSKGGTRENQLHHQSKTVWL